MKRLVLPALIIAMLSSAATAQSVTVTITQIKASGSGGEVTVDPALRDLASAFRQWRFSNYSLVSRTTSSVSRERSETQTLASGRYLDITLGGSDGQGASARHTLNIHVYNRTATGRSTTVNTTVVVRKGANGIIAIKSDATEADLLAIRVD